MTSERKETLVSCRYGKCRGAKTKVKCKQILVFFELRLKTLKFRVGIKQTIYELLTTIIREERQD
jgi:hypothetical protein